MIGLAGLALVVVAQSEFLLRLATARATRGTRVHDALVAAGFAVSLVGLAAGGPSGRFWIATALTAAWFVLTRTELRLGRSSPRVGVGAVLPAFRLRTTSGEERTDRDLARRAPSLVVFYRGKW